MQVNNKLIKENMILDNITPTTKYENGKRVFVKKIKGTLEGVGLTNIPCGMGELNYTPINYLAYFNTGTSLFQSNTPRGSGTNVDNTQLYSYWNYVSDSLVVVSNGFDRSGTIIDIKLYFIFNN